MCIVSVNIPEAVRQNTRMDTAVTTDFACQMVAVAYFLHLHQPLADCARIARMSIENSVLRTPLVRPFSTTLTVK